MDLYRYDGETDDELIQRIGSMKQEMNVTWDKIASTLNELLDKNCSESTYRKKIQGTYNKGSNSFESKKFESNNDDNKLHELQKIKMKISDERRALNKTLRETSRYEEDMDILRRCIAENGRTTLLPVQSTVESSDNDLFVCLSDFHFGLNVDNNFGSYSAEIAEARLSEYLGEIYKIKELHKSENCYLALLGDQINGHIHATTQLENRENLTEQVQKSAELISAFAYELSKIFKDVYINSVSGNHSRPNQKKDEVLRNDRLDAIIPWYMKAKLDHLQNVHFIDSMNYDVTIGRCFVRDNEYLLLHGDYDTFNQAGISKLVMFCQTLPTACFYGHLHHNSYDEISGVKLVRSGSFCGTVDDYVISKRIRGNASQMVCVLDKQGIRAMYPVTLH